ncbi:hypothetical protein L2E82_27777 [Cichorium intybus]|uniref:Uncharacterized protein n=1 Tax=Cichorium intybus TaxID=13427 RepID=A0ACB9CU81_CICIN|nr:hypothetical protein L2E82_27777 [Cichorium intybus]
MASSLVENPALMKGAVKLIPKMKELNNWKQLFLTNQIVWPPCAVKFNLSSLKKESFNAKEQVGEAHARATELEKQVEDLKNEIAKQKTKKDAFEPRINVAETKISELNEKLEKLQKTNEEQNIRIRNTEHALKKAEKEKIKVQLKVARYSKELTQFHDSWLPHCLSW